MVLLRKPRSLVITRDRANSRDHSTDRSQSATDFAVAYLRRVSPFVSQRVFDHALLWALSLPNSQRFLNGYLSGINPYKECGVFGYDLISDYGNLYDPTNLLLVSQRFRHP